MQAESRGSAVWERVEVVSETKEKERQKNLAMLAKQVEGECPRQGESETHKGLWARVMRNQMARLYRKAEAEEPCQEEKLEEVRQGPRQ